MICSPFLSFTLKSKVGILPSELIGGNNGTTYLPVRAVGEALNLDVSWNANTKTVSLNEKQAKVAKTEPNKEKAENQIVFIDVMPYHDYTFSVVNSDKAESGKEYKNVVYFDNYTGGYANYKLDKKYTTLSGTLYNAISEYKENDDANDYKIEFKGDKTLLYTRTLKPNEEINFNIDLTDVKDLRIDVDEDAIRISDAKLTLK